MSHRLEETKGTQQLNAMWDPRIDPGTNEKHWEKTGGSKIKFVI